MINLSGKTDEPPAKVDARSVDRVSDLERELTAQAELKRQRAETWREAVHDLRGHLGVVKNGVIALTQEKVSEPVRAEFLTMLHESLASIGGLLTDLMYLATLEAGRDLPKSQPLDAADVLAELSSEMQLQAGQRGLLLRAQGPDALPVEGDAIKVRRLAENLLLLALAATERGDVTMTWGEDSSPGADHWLLEIQGNAREPPAASSRDGIRLALVQCLCELLRARLEMKIEAGQGLRFRVVFPRHQVVR